MTSEQGSEHLTDDELKARAVEWFPEVKGWVEGASKPWAPAPGSALAEDDALAQGMTLSHLSRVSLVIGSEHLLTTLVYSVNYGPNLFSMQTLLRTAMIGGAQAVWLLSPGDQATRVDHADQLSRDAYWNQLMWANTLTTQNSDVIDQAELAVVKQNLKKLTPTGKRGAEVHLAPLVQSAAEYVYSQPPDPDIHSECVAGLRKLSGVAHALPWDLHTRAEKIAIEHAGHSGTLYLPSWTQLQGALSESYAFLKTGWRLLERQGALSIPHDD